MENIEVEIRIIMSSEREGGRVCMISCEVMKARASTE
jgi:hypothetical protein